ncbi:TauD/TfdA family dioxygenase [Gordonia sp. HY002]|uniref:TauD/TfdA dioxygenase family protein n=1 Tax=Gordonia zhenghanii TaxID=2911516 RepID=UPI001F36FADB|nr:TauD/TfdA family dioxygenase [Gordonia zhenghanii]MCF8571492.1 TauD/TfdA family dioxygenase [Gordonia zhenghanii]
MTVTVSNSTDRDLEIQAVYADAGITVDKLGEHIGARIGGVTLGGEVPAEKIEAIRLALAVNKAIVFTGQNHLDDESQYAFAQLLGDPTLPHPTVTSRGDQLLTIEGAANSWHTDVSFVDRIPKASILRAVNLPTWGGATTWASTTAAYNQLPDSLKAFVDGLWAKHTNFYDYVTNDVDIDDTDVEHRVVHYEEFTSKEYQTIHPVVRVHPETGEKTLLLGHFVKEFVGLKPAEFSAVYQLLQNRIIKLDNTFRWNWSLGDVAIWDNRATQHYGVADFGSQSRKLHRITLAGDVPVNAEGRTGEIITGDASHYSVVEQPKRLAPFAD